MKKIIFNKINITVNKLFFTIALLITNFGVFAQTDFPDDVDDTPSAPIDDYIWVLALVGLLLAFMWFRSIQNNKIKEKTS